MAWSQTRAACLHAPCDGLIDQPLEQLAFGLHLRVEFNQASMERANSQAKALVSSDQASAA